MKHRVPRVLSTALMAAVAAFPAHAADWGQVATVSTTLGINANRLCLGEGTRSDMGCPSYAPSVTTAGHVSVTGNLSANTFIGDGSRLTGLAAGDRITSGTTNIIANTNGAISFTTAGVERMVIGTNGNVGIGTSTASYPLDIAGVTGVRIGSGSGSVHPILQRDPTSGGLIIASDAVLGTGGALIVTNNSTELFRIRDNGNVGIRTAAPSALLHISATQGPNAELLLQNNGTGRARFVADSYGADAGITLKISGTTQGAIAAYSYSPMIFFSSSASDRVRA